MTWVNITGKAILKTIVEVSDVFPPLKSVAAGLKVIVERTEVRRFSLHLIPIDPNTWRLV